VSFGKNLQFLRRMRDQMTQEELAEKLEVSRQTISKWELDQGYPEMKKALEICQLFSCSLDQLIREDLNVDDQAYSPVWTQWVEPFYYLPYTVVSAEPEDDAKNHVSVWAKTLGISDPDIIGWDFPVPSQQLVNACHMHGYTAALRLSNPETAGEMASRVKHQEGQTYIAITIRDPFQDPFRLIPNAYQLLLRYSETNKLNMPKGKETVSCFEKEYRKENTEYMDVYLAVD
jgi:DNA-binding XRE family transcriptional regulator